MSQGSTSTSAATTAATPGFRPPRRLPGWFAASPALIFLGLLFVYPTLKFVVASFQGPAGLSLEHYTRMFTSPIYLQVMGITFQIAAFTTLFALLAGYPLAYYVARLPENRRNSLMIWVLLPFWTSFLVRTFAWMVLLGRNGPLNNLLALAGFEQGVTLIYNFTGVMIGMVHALMPYAVMTMISVMLSIDANLPKAAATLGAPPSQSFWRVYFPLSLPGVAAGGLLVFISALGFFITPALLGGAKEIMIAQTIYDNVNKLLNWGFGGALSMVLLLVTVIVFLIYDRFLGTATLYGGMVGDQRTLAGQAAVGTERGSAGLTTGKLAVVINRFFDLVLDVYERASALRDRIAPAHYDRPARPWSSLILAVAAFLVLFYLAAPIFMVVPVSFTAASSLEVPPKAYSLRWYETFLGSVPWLSATMVSLQVAVLTAIVATAIGTPAAFALVRSNFRGKSLMSAFLLSPMIFPRMVIAVALFYVFSQLRLVGTIQALVLGHVVLAVPYVIVTVSAVLKGYDIRLDQAGLILGASPWRVFYHITFPLIRTGMISGALFAFITSFDDLTVALFVTGGLMSTLPKKMWDDMTLQVNPTLAAVSTLLVAAISLVMLLVEISRRRSERARIRWLAAGQETA